MGAGNQSTFLIAATLTVLPTIKKVQVAALNPVNAKKFVNGIRYKLQSEFEISTQDILFEAVEDLEIAVKESDIIITVTPSRAPIIKKNWIF